MYKRIIFFPLLQEEPNNTRKPQFGASTKDKFFDDFEVVDKEEVSSGWGKGSSRLDEICAPSNSNKSAWEQVLLRNPNSLFNEFRI